IGRASARKMAKTMLRPQIALKPRRPREDVSAMRWMPGGRSDNLEDRRAEGGGRGFGAMPRIGLGGIVVLLVLSVIFRRDLVTPFLSAGGAGQAGSEATAEANTAEEPVVEFVSFVLDD